VVYFVNRIWGMVLIINNVSTPQKYIELLPNNSTASRFLRKSSLFKDM
jgi:hypothetical protein